MPHFSCMPAYGFSCMHPLHLCMNMHAIVPNYMHDACMHCMQAAGMMQVCSACMHHACSACMHSLEGFSDNYFCAN